MSLPAVILIRPREEGNVGAVARAMANMGLERLILVEPAPRLSGVARGFGVGGWKILDQVARAGSFETAIAPFGRVVGTASRRDRPLKRHHVITPRRLPEVLATDPAATETALVFGPEGSGLTRGELEQCSPVVAVPCASGHPTLNLAQAVLVLAYELRVASLGTDPAVDPGGLRQDSAREPRASCAEIEALEQQVAGLLLAIGYDQQPIRDRLLRDLRRLVIRAGSRRRDVRILRRLVNRAVQALARRGGFAAPE